MLIEVATLCIVLSRSPERCEAGERVLCLDSSTKAMSFTAEWKDKPHVLFSADLETALARDFALIDEIHYVLVESADNNLLVWIAAENATKQVRERIFQKELSLIDGFPEVDFDFNIIVSRGRRVHDFASSAKVIFSRGDHVLA